MELSSSKANQTPHHVRSASYPLKTKPLIQKIEQELIKLRKSEATSGSPTQTISIGLTGLAGLYKCVDDALNLPLNQHSFALARSDIKQLTQGSSKLLEVSTALREAVARLRALVRGLNLGSEADVSRYFALRKEILKGARGLASSLRQLAASLVIEQAAPGEVSVEATKALRCVSIINISVLESLLQLLMSKPKASKQSLISKLVGKGKAMSREHGDELSNVDAVLHAVPSKDSEKVLVAQKRLEALEVALKGIDGSLSCISARLSKIRASLAGIVSL